MNVEIRNIKVRYLFLFFTIAYISLYWYNFNFVTRDQLFYNSLGEQISMNGVKTVLELNKKFRWLSYAGVPVFLYLKWVLVATCLYIRLFFYDGETRFLSAMKVAAFAEIMLVFTVVIKLALLSFFIKPETLEQLQNFTPLSLYSVFKKSAVPFYFVYLLQSINLFELFYILFLSWGVKEITTLSFGKSIYYTFTSYGIGLLFWIVLVVFFQQYFS